MIEIQHNLDQLTARLGLYVPASRKTVGEVLRKKGKDLGISMQQEFKTLAPAKGQVRSERLEALKSGGGVHIRPSVLAAISKKYNAVPLLSGPQLFRTRRSTAGGQVILGKLRGTTRGGLNLQALLVQRELNIRERGRFFTSASALLGARNEPLVTGLESKSRFGPTLATEAYQEAGDSSTVTFRFGFYGSMSQDVVHALNRPRGQEALNRAIVKTSDDMLPYLQRHLGEKAVEVLKNS